MARGVSQLMYVGDDGLATGKPDTKEMVTGAVAAIVAWKSTGIVRLAAAGIAAWVGYRAYKARQAPTVTPM